MGRGGGSRLRAVPSVRNPTPQKRHDKIDTHSKGMSFLELVGPRAACAGVTETSQQTTFSALNVPLAVRPLIFTMGARKEGPSHQSEKLGGVREKIMEQCTCLQLDMRALQWLSRHNMISEKIVEIITGDRQMFCCSE